MSDESDQLPSSERHQKLAAEVRQFDANLRRLADYRIDMSLPGPALLASMRARKDEMRRQHEELAEMQHEADRQLLAEMLDLYVNGSDHDRRRLRELLHECRSFRWGFGSGVATRAAVVSEADARKALAVLSMKDGGGGDYRDQIMQLDHICGVLQQAGLPVVALLTEAAGWSSEVAPSPPERSTRALLLERAQRFAS